MTDRVLIITTVPETHLDALLTALAESGAGTLGHYTHCAFTARGVGRFRPDAAANPAVGEKLIVNEVTEVRIETWADRAQAKRVCAAIRAAHPYEEPVIYLLPLLDEGALE